MAPKRSLGHGGTHEGTRPSKARKFERSLAEVEQSTVSRNDARSTGRDSNEPPDVPWAIDIAHIFRTFFFHNIEALLPNLIVGIGNEPHILDVRVYGMAINALSYKERKFALDKLVQFLYSSSTFSDKLELAVIKNELTHLQRVVRHMNEAYGALTNECYTTIATKVRINVWRQNGVEKVWTRDRKFRHRNEADQIAIAQAWLAKLVSDAESLHARPLSWILRFQGYDHEVKPQEGSKCQCDGDGKCDQLKSILRAKSYLARLAEKARA